MTTTITITIAVTITSTISIRKKPEFGVHAQESFFFSKKQKQLQNTPKSSPKHVMFSKRMFEKHLHILKNIKMFNMFGNIFGGKY